MKKKLDDVTIPILHTRISLARDANFFSLELLAKNWQICRMTLYRYEQPRYREEARLDAKERHRNTKTDKTKCQLCFNLLEGHKRCIDCTMLQHGTPECSCDLIRNFLWEESLL